MYSNNNSRTDSRTLSLSMANGITIVHDKFSPYKLGPPTYYMFIQIYDLGAAFRNTAGDSDISAWIFDRIGYLEQQAMRLE